jgi:ribosomal protein S18 acetylase RimI-like enzyme
VITIVGLYTKPAYRRRSIATALVTQIGHLAVAGDIRLIELTVHRDNLARQFYERLGFQHVPEAVAYMVGLTRGLPASLMAAIARR